MILPTHSFRLEDLSTTPHVLVLVPVVNRQPFSRPMTSFAHPPPPLPPQVRQVATGLYRGTQRQQPFLARPLATCSSLPMGKRAMIPRLEARTTNNMNRSVPSGARGGQTGGAPAQGTRNSWYVDFFSLSSLCGYFMGLTHRHKRISSPKKCRTHSSGRMEIVVS